MRSAGVVESKLFRSDLRNQALLILEKEGAVLEIAREVSQLMRSAGGISTVTLADLIEMKLRSGSNDLLRAQDLADVIGLIRQRKLRSDFARHIDKTRRSAFRKLVRLIERENSR
jgi:hypothetical protein